MKNVKKKLLILLSSCAVALMMIFNVSVSMEGESSGADISLSGIEALAITAQEGCHGDAGDGSTFCEEICGEQGTEICTGMDCGSGTELCHRL